MIKEGDARWVAISNVLGFRIPYDADVVIEFSRVTWYENVGGSVLASAH